MPAGCRQRDTLRIRPLLPALRGNLSAKKPRRRRPPGLVLAQQHHVPSWRAARRSILEGRLIGAAIECTPLSVDFAPQHHISLDSSAATPSDVRRRTTRQATQAKGMSRGVKRHAQHTPPGVFVKPSIRFFWGAASKSVVRQVILARPGPCKSVAAPAPCDTGTRFGPHRIAMKLGGCYAKSMSIGRQKRLTDYANCAG
jgi:hypothetical protein